METLKSNISKYDSQANMRNIDKECEVIEKLLQDIEKFPSKTPADKSEKQKLLKSYSSEFESVVQSFQTSQNSSQKQYEKYDSFTEELRKEQRMHAQVIEGRMTHVHEMMQGFNEIVVEQGNKLDMIETDAENAKAYTSKGVDELYKTDTKQRRKKNFCKVMLILTALGVCVLVIVVLIMKT